MGVSLEDVESEGGDKRVGPVVRRVSGMIMRVKRLEGFSGLYKGESSSSSASGLVVWDPGGCKAVWDGGSRQWRREEVELAGQIVVGSCSILLPSPSLWRTLDLPSSSATS